MAAGIGLRGLIYLTSPLTSLLSEHELRKQRR